MHKIIRTSSSPDMWQTTIEPEHQFLIVDPLTEDLVDNHRITPQMGEPDVQQGQMVEIIEDYGGENEIMIDESGTVGPPFSIGDDEDLEDEAEEQEDLRSGPDEEDAVPEDGMTDLDTSAGPSDFTAPIQMEPPPPYAPVPPTPAVAVQRSDLAANVQPITSRLASLTAPGGLFSTINAAKSIPASIPTPIQKIAAVPMIAKITANAKSGDPRARSAIRAIATKAKRGNRKAKAVVAAINVNAKFGVGLGGPKRLGGLFAGEVVNTTGKVLHTVTRPVAWAIQGVGEVIEFAGDTIRDIGRKI